MKKSNPHSSNSHPRKKPLLPPISKVAEEGHISREIPHRSPKRQQGKRFRVENFAVGNLAIPHRSPKGHPLAGQRGTGFRQGNAERREAQRCWPMAERGPANSNLAPARLKVDARSTPGGTLTMAGGNNEIVLNRSGQP